jgi:hypothetical protein
MRSLSTDTQQYSDELIGSRIDGVGRGVVPLETISADTTPASEYLSTPDRPAIAFDGTKYLVVLSTSTAFRKGGFHGVFVGTDGSTMSSFQIVDGIEAPRFPALAYGDGRYLVAYPVMNGAFWGLLLSADGAVIGSQFTIVSGASTPATTVVAKARIGCMQP